MHQDILTTEQLAMLPTLRKFSKRFYMVGGTAISLQLGHRRSMDFNLFREKPFPISNLMREVQIIHPNAKTIFKGDNQVHFNVNGVKLTFFEYPFPIPSGVDWNGIIRMPDLLTLAAMKAFALGLRSKWKDYVDLYFLLNGQFSFEEVGHRAEELFGGLFSKKLFKILLGYFVDIDYSEEVEYTPGFEVTEEEVKAFLNVMGTQAF